jgi:hypothetical protein
MMASSAQTMCPASALAKSLLDIWLSGDHYRLRLELERVTRMPAPAEAALSPDADDESDSIELLKSMARRMSQTSDLSAFRPESPRIATWLDLLRHMSVRNSTVN